MQPWPATQLLHVPPAQKRFVPHDVPSPRFPDVVQTDAPVPQDVVPALQTVPAGVHALLAAHATHAPLLHT